MARPNAELVIPLKEAYLLKPLKALIDLATNEARSYGHRRRWLWSEQIGLASSVLIFLAWATSQLLELYRTIFGPYALNAEDNQTDYDVADITIAIVNYNTAFLLDRLFSALGAAQGRLKLQIIVIDNVSRDNSLEIVREKYPFVELIANDTNVGFGRANNQALARMRGRYLLLLNTDAFVATDTLANTFEFMERNPRCGVLGVKLVGEDGALQPSCRFFPTPWNIFLVAHGLEKYFPKSQLIDDESWDHRSVRQCDWVPGCFYLVRKAVLDQLGLFDPRFFLYYEEVDHCRRVRQAGWDVIYYPYTEVVHVGGESAKSDAPLTCAGRQISKLRVESELLYFRKHHGIVAVTSWIALVACGALLSLFKDVVRPAQRGQRSTHRQYLATILLLLTPTRWGLRPTR
jgi:GT2 family glycosyltransferase